MELEDRFRDAETGLLPWERQKSEPVKAFAMFTVYRDMPPVSAERRQSRSIRNAVRSLYGDLLMARVRQFQKWSARWDWVDRSARWDDYLDATARLAKAAAIEEMIKRHTNIGRLLQARGGSRLADMEPVELTPDQTRLFLIAGVQLEREAVGMASTTIALRDALPIDEGGFALTNLPAAELDALIRSKIQERLQRVRESADTDTVPADGS